MWEITWRWALYSYKSIPVNQSEDMPRALLEKILGETVVKIGILKWFKKNFVVELGGKIDTIIEWDVTMYLIIDKLDFFDFWKKFSKKWPLFEPEKGVIFQKFVSKRRKNSIFDHKINPYVPFNNLIYLPS